MDILDDEESVGNWMIDYDYDMRVEYRIACPERDYPESEALYPSIKAWEAETGKDWYEEINP